MPNYDLNFNSTDYALIASQEGTDSSNVNFGSTGDYIRITLFANDGNNVYKMDDRTEAIFYATPDETNINLQIPGRITNPDIVEDKIISNIKRCIGRYQYC